MTPVTFTATGGVAPYGFSVDPATPLPAGLSFNTSTTILSGTTTVAPGVYTFTMRVVDGDNCPGSTAYSLTVGCSPISIGNTSPLPQGMVGVPYSQTLTATTPGTGVPAQTYTWAIASGTLPTGLALNSATGVISGTPTASSTANVTVQVTNQQLCSGTKSFSLTIGCPSITITPSPLPPAFVNGAYSTTLSASGGNVPYTWALTSGSLPAGISFTAATGTLSGTPTTTGSTNLTFVATDRYGCTSMLNSAFQVQTMGIGNLVWYDCNNNGVRDAGEVGLDGVSVTLYRDNGNNTRDAGDTLVATQTTSGGGAYAFTNLPPGTYYVQVVPPSGYPLTSGTPVTTDNKVDNTNHGLQPGGLNTALYSPMIPLVAGAEPINDGDSDPNTNWTVDFGLWSGIDVGNLVWNDADNSNSVNGSEAGVPGVTVELLTPGSDNAIGGTGTAADAVVATTTTNASGNYDFKVYVPGKYFVRVTPPVSLPLPTSVASGDDAVNGENKGSQPAGVGTYIYSPVLTLAACTEPGGTGSTNVEDTVDFGLRVCPTLTIAPGTLPNAVQYSAYNQTMTASGGTLPYTWSISAGALPPGLTVSSTGAGTAAITGVPGSTASLITYNATLHARDALGCTVDKPVAITVGCPVITINQTSLPAATQYSPYTTTLTATTTGTSGVSYVWTLVSGTLPNGLTFNSNGTISGTPTGASLAGVFNITVKATDPNGCSGTGGVSLVLSCPTISLNGTLAAGVEDSPYSQTLNASGGTAPYIWTVSLGVLPTGLVLNSSTGTISGTPSVVQSATFTLRATDVNACFSERSYSIAIGCP